MVCCAPLETVFPIIFVDKYKYVDGWCVLLMSLMFWVVLCTFFSFVVFKRAVFGVSISLSQKEKRKEKYVS